jgi:tRNA pseudouridine38-40 synthase
VARWAVGVEYNGAAYSGWQSQVGVPTVQSTLSAAIGVIANHPVELVCAGRTDAGVHARAQVVHFDSAAPRTDFTWLVGTNANLPADINARWVVGVPEHFHARFAALSRTYRYYILNRHVRSALAAGRAWSVYHPLDAAAMQAAADLLLGEHDFSAFRAAECQARSPIRTLQSAVVTRAGDWIVIEVRANAFLQHMVRNMAGTLVAVGRGEAPPGFAREQLDSRDRRVGAATAPAAGLYFWGVEYPAPFGLAIDSAMIEPQSLFP